MQNNELETAMLLEEKDALLHDFWLKNTFNKTERNFFNDFLSAVADDDNRVAVATLSLSKTECATIRDLCSDQTVLIFNFYATAFSILLARYFSLTEISFMAPYAQFNHFGDDRHYFLFRSFIDQQQSFKNIFVRNKTFVSASLRYNNTYDDIRQSIDPEVFDALSQVSFTLNYPDELFSEYQPAFSCGIVEDNDAPFLHIQYKKGFCSATVAELFLHNLEHLIREIIQKIYEPVHTLSVHSKNEKKLLSEFNETGEEYPLDKTIVTIFEEQVERTPYNIALVSGTTKLDYKSLNELSNRFAAYLKKNYDLQKDDLVTIKLDRSEWLAVVILGIFKSGAAYVPIDPDYPANRIDYILSHSGSKTLIDNAELGHFRLQMDNYPETNLPDTPSPADLAYVIYTSGSTGNPKGVMVEHLGMLNHLFAKQSLLALDAGSTIVQNASQSFDISVWQFFAALLVGGKVIIYGKDVAMNPSALISSLENDKPTVLEAVPSFLDAMLDVYDDAPYKKLDFLEFMVVTGEELRQTLVKRWFKHFPKKTVVNAYGPTEASDDITHQVIHEYNNNKRIPIGKTVSNFKIYIVDDYMNLCPLGVRGEICVSGPGVGRGYLDDIAKTSKVFIADPFLEAGDVRMYKTGDIGRYVEDGSIEFFGRKDEQVKIRGNRIEPGEIESVLQNHEGIEGAIVLAVPGIDGEKKLIAYITTTIIFDFPALRSYLSDGLPVYMMPSAFVQLQSFPLTPNGKIDRIQLISMANLEMQDAAAYVAPRNETEQKLIFIWQNILGKERIGVKDNFFDVGGHSLRIMRLAGKIYKDLNVRVSLKQLFSAATIELQAQLVKQSAKGIFSEIPVVEPAGSHPLSAQQQRLWMLCQFEDASAAYNIPRAFFFEGTLDTRALEYAFAELIQRHEILRTLFRADEEGNTRQYVLRPEEMGFEIKIQDIGACTEDKKQEEISAFIEEDFTSPFDLASGPLLRGSLIRLGNNRWVLIYVMHHIISDGWSMDILFRELMTLYVSYNSKSYPLNSLRIQYKDYVYWQQQQLSGENTNDLRRYWLKRFEGELPVLQLPVHKPRPSVKTYNGKVFFQTINADLSSRLNYFAQKQGGSLFMSLLAIVNTLLYKYTSQEDIIIGTPIAGREHIDLEGQVGYYINTLALRTRFKEENSFDQLFELVKNVTLDAYEHQSYPFDRLVDELNLNRDISRSALFDVMVILQNTGDNNKSVLPVLDTLRISEYPSESYQTSKFDLTFNFVEVDQQLQVGIEYNSDIFPVEMIERMAAHLVQIIEVALAQPSVPIRQLDYLRHHEKMKLLEEFNPGVIGTHATKTIAKLFEERVEREPDAIALVYEGKAFTCRQLNESATKLAAYLRTTYNIGPNDLVGIQLVRNEWMLITILGILKSGGAYLPIDTSYPEERVAYLLQDSGCKVLIDEAELSRFFEVKTEFSNNNPEPVNTPHDLAYVIYTSGSTGKPKGVMIEQRSVVDFFTNFRSRFFLTSDMVLGATTNYTFDISVLELLGSLVCGIKLFLINSKDPEIILQHIATGEINALQVTPSRLNQMLEVDQDSAQTIGLLKVLLAGGEALSQTNFDLLKQFKSTHVINVYGPTETTIWSSSLYLRNASSLSIGRPLINEQIFITNEALQLCPIGVIGEICIGGTGLARGYINNPGLTAEKFVSNPFKAGEKMYRTGDLGAWQEDGNILFVGRKDDQVKIQGYRIDPGEIENALQQLPNIDAAVVIARPAAIGKQLVAYIKSKTTLLAEDLRSFLGNSIPDYMVPSHFILMDEFPFTTSGKIDRKKLQETEAKELNMETDYLAPRDETEEKITLVWQEMLGRIKIGIRDNFFVVGGNSLIAVKVLSRIRKNFGIDIRIEDIFNNVTIESLAKEVSRKMWATDHLIVDTEEISIVTI